MNEFDQTPPAFPCSEDDAPGLSTLSWFAGQALTGILSTSWDVGDADQITRDQLAREAFLIARAMVDAMNETSVLGDVVAEGPSPSWKGLRVEVDLANVCSCSGHRAADRSPDCPIHPMKQGGAT